MIGVRDWGLGTGNQASSITQSAICNLQSQREAIMLTDEQLGFYHDQQIALLVVELQLLIR
jgi:hypothetical protein